MMGYGYGGYGHFAGDGSWGIFAGFSMITHLAFIILLIMAIIWFYKTVFRNSIRNNSIEQNNAIDILKQRYAKGEITSEEYHRIKKDLE
ncbi:SHOCT domain-containing protein [Pectinatus brassicae]|uniref:Putative membrane protein n=1 Tax=Pectinatus brassicae TaxID=862415 RepID=A0A840UT26_9FIRM|nr:SHOCT domain-containing protein [Pectinatus brassicae]MBB5335655.1 putative membrane protein [Pectinatus brassicae]